MRFYIVQDELSKGTWGDERPGHKYLKRERGADGQWRYWYPEEHEREDKPATAKRKHEEDDYRPPVMRYSDAASIEKLLSIGDGLAAAQDGITRDDTGFNNSDVKSWGFVAAHARADDPASMHRLRTFLAKYKRQITGSTEEGLDEFYKLGLHDALTAQGDHGGPVMMTRWRVSDGALLISVSGRIKNDWQAYMALNRSFKVQAKKDREGNWYNYVEPADVEGFDFEGYGKRLLEEFNVKLAEIPERPIMVAPVEAPPHGVTATVQPESAGNPMTTDDVINDIVDKRAYNTIAVKVLTQGEKAGNLAIWSTFSKDFNAIMSNKSTDPRAITGIVEVQKDLGWARITNDPRLYEEALAKLRQHLPNFTFVIDPNVDEWKAVHESKTSERQKPIPEVQAKINPEIKPFPFQNAAVRFFQENDGNGLLGDEMGLGKTLEALSYAAATDKRVIVVCPKVVRKNWLLEAKRFFPGHFDDVKELKSKDLKTAGMPDLSKVKIATINYEILAKFLPAIKAGGFDLLIVDESHRIKNPKAQLTQNVQKIAEGMKHKILLSGTALKNKREELFTQLELVRPGFVTKGELRMGMIGVLHHKLDKVYLARKKKDVVANMPPKLRQAVVLEVPDAPGVKSKDADEAYAEGGWMEDAELTADERREMGGGGDLAEVTRIKHETAKAKAPVTAEFVKELLASSDSSVLVYTDSVPAAYILAEKLGPVAVLHTGKQRDAAEDAARAHFDPLRHKEGDPVRVLVSTTAKGIGFNGQIADKVVFNDLPWTPADKDQAEDRAYRIGTKNTVNVYDIHAEGSAFDTATAQLLLKKAVLYHKLLDGHKMSAEETAWATSKMNPSDILAAMRGEPVGPKVAEVDAPPIKTSTGMTVIQPVPEATPKKLAEEGHKAPPKSEYQIQYEREEAERKAKADAAEVKQQDHYRAAVAVTSPFAAQHIPDVDLKVRPYFEKLHEMEATQGSKGAHMEIPREKGSALARWFDAQRKAQNPRVSAGQVGTNHHFYSSPAGDLHLWLGWHGEESSWNLDYTTLGNGTLDALPPERQKVLDELLAKNKEPEHNERPKFVIPQSKPIEESQHETKSKAEAKEHVGDPPIAPTVKLEAKVDAAGQQQLALFKSMDDDLYVISANDFDLCMSWADRLIAEGEYDRATDLIKAAMHKYLRRYPSGKATPRWYYVYKITSKHVGQPVQEGEKIKLTHEGQTGHYEVEKVHPNGYATVRHDETGHRMSVKTDHLHEMFSEEHKGAIEEAHARLKQTFEAAKKYGSESQKERAREALKGHEDRFSIKTPERIAGTRALSLTVLTHTEPSVENHQAAADAHQQAADLGAPQTDLHRQLADLHRIAAKRRIALQASAAALKDPENRFHVPSEDANKASTPVIVLPKRGGQRKASGAFFGSKEQAYHSIMVAAETNEAFLDQFNHADKAYRAWKAGQGPKPPSWGGGELDHLNQALSLVKPRRVIGKQPKDPTLTSPAEAWDRLVKGAKRWDSQTTRHALQVFHEWFADHGINFQLPDEAEAAINARHLAEQTAEYEADMGGEHQAAVIHDHMQQAAENDASFDPDKIEDELDTSFDFGFNVQAEDADPHEEYQKSGTKAKTFKGWFGDWESDPHNASKVVNEKGEPAEQHNMAPMPVYHGTAVGGFTAFDPEKIAIYNIFGEGFYFTEDKGIAKEYTEKKSDDAKWGSMHGLTDASGKEVTHLPAKWAQKVIASTPGFGGEPTDYADWDAQCVAAALKRAMDPRGVNVAKFLQEYRAPSGPVLDSKGEPDKYSHHGTPMGLRSFVKRLSKEKVGDYKPAVTPPQVFECYLNIRKPIDMDKPLTREDFRDLAGYMTEREKEQYRPKYLGDKKAGPSKWQHGDTIPFYTKNLNDHPDVRAMGDDAFGKAFTYDDFLTAKGHLRKDIGEEGKPAYPIFHLSDEKTLTWGDVHYIMSDGHNYQTAKQLFKDWAQQRGYDGIAHTGGWNVGTHAHRVWIAWTPNQVKAVGNEGTFNNTTNDIYKAMKPENQPHIFVIIPDDLVLIPERLEKAERGGQVEGHKYIKREGEPGHYQYTYTEPAGGQPGSRVVMMGPLDEERVEAKTRELQSYTRDELEEAQRRLATYRKRLGESVPANVGRWERVVNAALATKPPRMVATPPAPPPTPVIPVKPPAPAAQPPKPPKLVVKVTPKPNQGSLDFAAHPKPMLETKAKPAVTQAPKAKTGRKELAVDVGTHVTGTRWEKAQALTVTDLEHMTPEDQVRAVTKKNLMPTWEPQELLDRGLEPEAVLLRNAMEKCIIEKPANEGRSRRYYIEGMDFFAKSMDQCKTKQDIMDFIEDWHHLIQGQRRIKTLSADEVGQAYDDYLVSQGKKLTMPYAERKKIQEEIEQLSDSKYGKGWKYDSPEWKAVDEKVRALKDDFEARGGGEYRFMPLNQVIARALKIDEHLDVSYGREGEVTVFARDPNLESKVNDNNTYARMAAGFGKTFVGIVGHSSPKHHGPKIFRDALGATERWAQDKLSHEDRIKALHERMGAKRTAAKPREAPFKWERDVPGEIDRKGGKPVGDVTPQELAKDFGFKNVQFGHWVTDKDAHSHLKGAYGAFSDLADILGVDVKRVSMNGRLAIGIGARGSGKFAAHYEPGKAIINITKIAGGGCLAHEWAHAMDNLLSVSHDPTSTKAGRMVSDGATEGIPPRVRDAYADVMAAIRSKNPDAQKKLTEANALIKRLNAERRRATPEENQQINEAQRAASENKHSEFYQDASSFSKAADNYWTRGHEMFARAFESFIEDTLSEEGRKSSYLVAGTQVKYPTGRTWTQKDGTERECQMYPQGEERKRINAAIRRLIEAMGEEKSLEKAIAWLEQQPLQRFTIQADMSA